MSKRAVSIVVALVLLIMIVIVAASTSYYWLVKLQGDIQAGAEVAQSELTEQVTGELRVERFEHSSTLTNAEIIIKNTGTREIKDFGDSGDLLTVASETSSCTVGFNSSNCDVCPFDFGVGEVKVINLDFAGSDCEYLKKGMQYDAYFALGDARTYTSFITGIRQNQWTLKSPATSPSARDTHAMAMVDKYDKVILFGGFDGTGNCDDSGDSYCNGTWVYDLDEADWSRMTTPSSSTNNLSARINSSMATIDGTDKVVLFGGNDGDGNCDDSGADYCNGTWVYNLSADSWTKMTTLAGLYARSSHAMAGIYNDDKAVLFGGYNGSNNADTWVYDLSADSWTKKSPSTSPGARRFHAMAGIYNDDKVVLFGGLGASGCDGSGSTRCNGTWVYDLSDDNWTQKSPSNNPSARYGHKMAAFYNTDKIVLFGGHDGSRDDETWVYDLSADSWTKKNLLTYPGARVNHEIATVYNDDKVVLFGGNDSSYDAETWIYT